MKLFLPCTSVSRKPAIATYIWSPLVQVSQGAGLKKRLANLTKKFTEIGFRPYRCNEKTMPVGEKIPLVVASIKFVVAKRFDLPGCVLGNSKTGKRFKTRLAQIAGKGSWQGFRDEIGMLPEGGCQGRTGYSQARLIIFGVERQG
jgi:hypothetical protein